MRQGRIVDIETPVTAEGPLISLIVPVYNTPVARLRRCFSSLLRQNYPNMELIVVDDGSDGPCVAVLDELRESDARVRLIPGGHKGVSHARNVGIEAARGEWLAFSDADDAVELGFLSDALRIAYAERVDFVCGSVSWLFKGENPVVREDAGKYWVVDSESEVWAAKMQMLGTQKYGPCGLPDFRGRGPIAKLFRRSTLGHLRFDEGISIGEDTLFNYQFMEKCRSLAVVDRVWYWYYQYRDSSIHIPNPSKWASSIDALMAYGPTGDERLAFDSRCAHLVMEGTDNFIAGSGPCDAYRAAKDLYDHVRDKGWISSQAFDGYSTSSWLRLYADCLKRDRFGLAFSLCVVKQLKNRLQSKRLIGEGE